MNSNRIGVVVVATLLASIIWAGPVDAAGGVTSNVFATYLSVSGDVSDNQIVIACTGGNVTVNGADPDNQSLACNLMSSLYIDAGAGQDNISLESVLASSFTASPTIAVHGGDGNDSITGSELADTLLGEAGNDSIAPKVGADDVQGGADDDVLNFDIFKKVTVTNSKAKAGGLEKSISGFESVSIVGTDHADRYTASRFSGDAFLAGLGGSDILVSGSGLDHLLGGNGADILKAGGGRDELQGEAGPDELYGGSGKDKCSGGPGKDAIFDCP